MVHVDAGILTAAEPTPTVPSPAVPTSTQDEDASGLCRIENGPGLSRSDVLRISCDAALVTLIDSAVPGEQLRLGRKPERSPRHYDALCDSAMVGAGSPGATGCPTWMRTMCGIGSTEVPPTWTTWCCCAGGITWQFTRKASPSHLPPGSIPTGSSTDPTAIPIPHQPRCDSTIDSDPPAPTPMDPENIRPGWRGERFSLADSVAVFCGASEPRVFEQVLA